MSVHHGSQLRRVPATGTVIGDFFSPHVHGPEYGQTLLNVYRFRRHLTELVCRLAKCARHLPTLPQTWPMSTDLYT